MEIVKVYQDAEHANRAEIERHTNKKTYIDDTATHVLYRVVFYADYDHSFIYHVVCFETLSEAEKHISEYPFFKEV